MDDIIIIIQIIVGLLTIGGAIWWVGRAFNKAEVNFARVDGRLDKIDTRLDGIDARFDGIEKNIGKLFDAIIGKGVSKSSSPIALTEYGLKLKEKIDVDSLIEKYAKNVQIADESNRYHIQETCFDFAENSLSDLLSDKERGALESLAFEEGISLDSVMRVCAISLRDYKLKELGKGIKNMDNHTPGA